jgi:hypothetical protein
VCAVVAVVIRDVRDVHLLLRAQTQCAE